MQQNGHISYGFEFGQYRLFPNERLLLRDERQIALTPRVFDVLMLLVEKAGDVATKDDLIESVWHGEFVEEGNISRAVSTLRKKLGSQPDGRDFIQTVPKVGYRFIAPITLVKPQHPEIILASPPAGRRSMWVVGALILLLVLIASGGYFLLRSPVRNATTVDGLIDLTNDPAEDSMPTWSPDGRHLAFQSNRFGPDDIFVMAADGSDLRRLTDSPAEDHSPTWSPDGKQILFESNRDGNKELYVMEADGSGQTRLTFSPATDGGPARFSPDSKLISFARNVGPETSANYDIYVMNADGSGVRQLTFDKEFDAEPVWSPDGTKVYFLSGRNRNFDIFSINLDGSGETVVSTTPQNDLAFGFTADARQIYVSGDTPERFQYGQVFMMNPDGTNRRQITSFTEKVERVAYSAAAGKFAVVVRHNGSLEIGIMDAPAN